jgi:hypothetical protein
MGWKVKLAIVVISLAAGSQLFQPERSNPRFDPGATFEAVARPSPEVGDLLRRACYDCHSNETRWPWYSRVSPVSWLIARDVRRGRAHLNFSEWNRLSTQAAQHKLSEACEEVRTGEMPPALYRWVHPEARLSAADADRVCAAFKAP